MVIERLPLYAEKVVEASQYPISRSTRRGFFSRGRPQRLLAASTNDEPLTLILGVPGGRLVSSWPAASAEAARRFSTEPVERPAV